MTLYNINTFPYDKIKKIENCKKSGNQGVLKEKYYIKNIITAFDIETTLIRCTPFKQVLDKETYDTMPTKLQKEVIKNTVMYVWQWYFDGVGTVIGRKWDDLITFISRLKNQMDNLERLVCYVHNLSYEFQFLKSIISFDTDSVFAMSKHKILKAVHDGWLEFRCSYLQTNMSLDLFLKKMNVKNKKLKLNYDKPRYYWTRLSKKEIEYCNNDVEGLCQALKKEMAQDGDNLLTIPLTSTGYVRRDVKHVMRPYRNLLQKIYPTFDDYIMMRECFWGGDTRASRFYADDILSGVQSFDRSSSYPHVLCACEFPMTKFITAYKDEDGMCDTDYVLDLIYRRKYAVMARVSFENLRLRDKYNPAPYLPIHKCREAESPLIDNGRILSASYLETSVTDIDFKIILQDYDFDNISIIDAKFAKYGKLPKSLRDLILMYYKLKTELKGVDGSEELYNKSKNKLNAIYGLMVQELLKDELIFNGLSFDINQDIDLKAKLEDSAKNPYTVYQWGVWTTAHARAFLREGVRAVGYDFVYCDTDSVKFIGDHKDVFDKINERILADSKKLGLYAVDKKGNSHYMGVFESEEPYRTFKTMGAKKYAYTLCDDSDIHITIAGVNKINGAKELKAAGGLKAFKEGFVFNASDILVNHIDTPLFSEINVDGRSVIITSNTTIDDCEYQLGLTDDYRILINLAKKKAFFRN